MTATDGATTTVELIGGASEGHPVELDSDMNIVIRVTNIDQKVKVVTTKSGASVTKIFSLNDLILEEASE